MIEQHVLDKVHEYVNGCFDYVSTAKDLRVVVREALELAEPYVRNRAVLEAAENLELPAAHNGSSFAVRASLATYAGKAFREATDQDLPDEAREEAEQLEALAGNLEAALKLPGGTSRDRAATEKWIRRLYVRAHNLRGVRE
jgi:hypothetical protein